jgi:hypothetical protein
VTLSRRVLLTMAAGAASCASAPPGTPVFATADLAVAERLRDQALTDPHAWRLLRELCTQVGARPAGSDADARAQAWALQALRGLGLERVRAEPFDLRVWQRGPASAELLAPRAQPLVILALGNIVATPADGLQAEVAWYPDLAALRADSSDRARGRIVIVGEETRRTRDGAGYIAAFPARASGPVEAARRYGDAHGQQPHQWVGESDFGAGAVWQLRARVRPAALPQVARMAQVLAPRFRWPAVQIRQDGSTYFDVHHTVNDTLERVDPATLPSNVAAWAVTAWLAAQSPLDFFPLA